MADTVTLTDHEAIRDWAAARAGSPAVVDVSPESGMQPMLRIVFGQQIFRFLTAVPKGNTQLDSIANTLRTSFRKMTPQEIASLMPLRVRVVTVKPGETVATMAARMMGTERKLDMFRMINAMGATATIQPGQRVKIISE
jgi:predicted Zn-dependent protease